MHISNLKDLPGTMSGKVKEISIHGKGGQDTLK